MTKATYKRTCLTWLWSQSYSPMAEQRNSWALISWSKTTKQRENTANRMSLLKLKAHFQWHTLFNKTTSPELDRWLCSNELWLLFQRTQVQFPAPTWMLTTVCNSISRKSKHPRINIHAGKTPVHINKTICFKWRHLYQLGTTHLSIWAYGSHSHSNQPQCPFLILDAYLISFVLLIIVT